MDEKEQQINQSQCSLFSRWITDSSHARFNSPERKNVGTPLKRRPTMTLPGSDSYLRVLSGSFFISLHTLMYLCFVLSTIKFLKKICLNLKIPSNITYYSLCDNKEKPNGGYTRSSLSGIVTCNKCHPMPRESLNVSSHIVSLESLVSTSFTSCNWEMTQLNRIISTLFQAVHVRDKLSSPLMK